MDYGMERFTKSVDVTPTTADQLITDYDRDPAVTKSDLKKAVQMLSLEQKSTIIESVEEFKGNLEPLQVAKANTIIIDGEVLSDKLEVSCYSCEAVQTHLIKGVLHKLSPQKMVGWQKRYFALYSNRLKYWKSEKEFNEDKHPKGIINFDSMMVHIELQPEKFLMSLFMFGCERVFSLKALEENNFNLWAKKLDGVIKGSEGFKQSKEIRAVDFKIDFWRFDLVDESTFLS